MNKQEFLQKVTDVLQTEEVISFETILEDLDEWDSLSKMSIIAFLDSSFNKKITFNEINNFVTVADIAKMVELDD